MPPTWTVYDNHLLRQANGNAVDLDTATIKVIVLTAAYTPSKATHDFRDDLGATEVAPGSTYPAGGITLANKTVTLAGGVITWSFDHVVIAQDVTGFLNGRYVVTYVANGGAAAADPLIAYADLGADKSIQTGSLTLQIDALGAVGITSTP